MVKIRHFLPDSSNASLKVQLINRGVLDKTNELIYRMSPGAVDPAILKCGSLSFRRYTKSALLLLRQEPLSNEKPTCLNDIHLKIYPIWKIPQSHGSHSGPNHHAAKDNSNVTASQQPHPPQQQQQQQQDIPLTPRKHFSMMPAFASRHLNGSGTNMKDDDRRMMFDQFVAPNSSVWSKNSTTSHNNCNNNNFFNDNNHYNDKSQNHHYSGPPMGRRERGGGGGPDYHHSSSNHGPSDGGAHHQYNDEPEWMNCGPISRLDVIELRGFDSDGEDDLKRRDNNKNESSGTTTTNGGDSPPPARSTPAKDGSGANNSDVNSAGHCLNISSDDKHNDDPKLDFNFDFLTDESMTSIAGHEKSGTDKSGTKGHVWFADEQNNGAADNSMNDSNKLMEFFLKGKQIRALTHAASASENIPTLNDIEAKIIPEVKPLDNFKKQIGTQLNPAAAPFVKKDVRTTVVNEQKDFFNKMCAQLSVTNKANQIGANLNIIKALQQYQMQQINQRALQQQAQFQQLRDNSELLRTPEAQVLLQGLASGQMTYQSLQQQMNQPNKRSNDIIRTVLNYATTIPGRGYLHNIQLIQQLSNNKIGNGKTLANSSINSPQLNNRKFEQMNQHHLQQVQLQMQRQVAQSKVPIELHQHTENIMLEAMRRKRQQEMLKLQIKINENNPRNGGGFDFRRFSLPNQQQQQQHQLNGMSSQQRQQHHHQQQQQQHQHINLNSMMLNKSGTNNMMQNENMQQFQQQQQQQKSQYPNRGISFPINQQQQQASQHIPPPYQLAATTQHQNPFMGRPILKSSIGSMNKCPTGSM